MNKKYTYKPTSSVKYGKGGKNKKKSYRDNYSKKTDGNHFEDWGFLSSFIDPIVSLFGIGDMQDILGGEQFETDAAAAGGVYGMGVDQQEAAGTTGAELAMDIAQYSGIDFDPLNLTSVATLQDQIDNIGIARPKKTSTEFVEGIKDTIGQQTTGVLGEIGKTGKMTGIKDVMSSADQAFIGAQEKAAGMDERYQQQLTDIEKFETGQVSQLVGQQAQQEFGAASSLFDLAGDLAAQSAAAGGDLSASAISGLIELQGQQAAAVGDIITGGLETILGLIDFNPFGDGEDGMKIPKAAKGAKMQEYEEGAKQDMLPAEEADVTPGKFSHKENPIDIVQDGEKIGEMTGGEAIMPVKDVKIFEKLLAEGDKDGVFDKLEQLFEKWDRKAEMYKEKDLDQREAMGGAKMRYQPKSTINYR